MNQNKCDDCLRFDRPCTVGEQGWCSQCGEHTSPEAQACYWFTPRRQDNEEKEN